MSAYLHLKVAEKLTVVKIKKESAFFFVVRKNIKTNLISNEIFHLLYRLTLGKNVTTLIKQALSLCRDHIIILDKTLLLHGI